MLINQLLRPHYCTYLNKLLHVYSECIITGNELVDLIEGALTKTAFKSQDDTFVKSREFLIQLLKATLVKYREFNRKKFTIFKPLADQDFSTSLRTTHSYVAMPSIYPSFSSAEDEMGKQLLNR